MTFFDTKYNWRKNGNWGTGSSGSQELFWEVFMS